MSKTVITWISIAAVVVFIVVGYLLKLQSTHDASVVHESGIEAQYKSNENSLSTVALTAVEVMKVADAARDDAIAIVTAAMKGKYGDAGSTAKMLWSNDGGLSGVTDPSIRKEVARIITGGRKNFQAAQDILIDKCNVYKIQRDSFVSGHFTRVAGFPKLKNLEKICTPISSQYARDAFETGIQQSIL